MPVSYVMLAAPRRLLHKILLQQSQASICGVERVWNCSSYSRMSSSVAATSAACNANGGGAEGDKERILLPLRKAVMEQVSSSIAP